MEYDITKNPNFQFGRVYGRIAQSIISRTKDVKIDHERYDCLYDFQACDGLKYEVKANKKSVEYKTFYIELTQSINDRPFKPSGLKTSKADYWLMLQRNQKYLK